MSIYTVIILVYIFFSLIVAIVYTGTKFRFYFWFGVSTDIINIMLWAIFSLSAQTLLIPLHYLILFSLNDEFFLRRKYWVLAGLIPILILNYFTTNRIQLYVLLGIYIILLFLFLRYFVLNLIKSNRISVFYITMIFYELIIIFKTIAVLNDSGLGINIFFVADIIQICIAIVLILIRNRVMIPISGASNSANYAIRS